MGQYNTYLLRGQPEGASKPSHVPPISGKSKARRKSLLTSKAEREPSIDRRLCSRRRSSARLLRCVKRSALATRACAGVDARMSTCSFSLITGRRGEGEGHAGK